MGKATPYENLRVLRVLVVNLGPCGYSGTRLNECRISPDTLSAWLCSRRFPQRSASLDRRPAADNRISSDKPSARAGLSLRLNCCRRSPTDHALDRQNRRHYQARLFTPPCRGGKTGGGRREEDTA